MSAQPFDLVVVGDGVAASAALIGLGPQPRERVVAVVAPARETPVFRVGEHLSAAANPILDDLGLRASFRAEGHVEAHASFASWGSSGLAERNAMGDPRGAGWSLDRGRFDAWLRREARVRCDPVQIADAVVGVERRGSAGLRLALKSGETLDAHFVLDASGRAAAVARRMATRERLDRLIAIYDYFDPVDPDVEPTAGTLIEAMPSGWFYSALLPGRRLVVAWFTDADLLDSARSDRSAVWKHRIECSTHTRERLRTAGYSLDTPSLPIPRRADVSTRWCHTVAGPGWAAAGDAAAAFDPLSSHGLTTSLWSGSRVAHALAQSWAGDSVGLPGYAETFASGVARFRAQRRAIYAAEHRFASEPFWQRRHAASSNSMASSVKNLRDS